MSRNIVRHLRFSKSEYDAVSRKAEYLKMPEGRFIRKIAVQGNLKRYDLYELRKITRAFRYCGDSLEQIRKIAETEYILDCTIHLEEVVVAALLATRCTRL